MVELFTILIILISFFGMVVIIRRKIPVLLELSSSRKERSFFKGAVGRVRSNGFVQSLAPETLLQRILSKFRVLTLRTESKTADWLKELRQKSIEKRKSFSDDYWKKIRGRK